MYLQREVKHFINQNLCTSEEFLHGPKSPSKPVCQHGVDQLHVPVPICCAPLGFVLIFNVVSTA